MQSLLYSDDLDLPGGAWCWPLARGGHRPVVARSLVALCRGFRRGVLGLAGSQSHDSSSTLEPGPCRAHHTRGKRRLDAGAFAPPQPQPGHVRRNSKARDRGGAAARRPMRFGRRHMRTRRRPALLPSRPGRGRHRQGEPVDQLRGAGRPCARSLCPSLERRRMKFWRAPPLSAPSRPGPWPIPASCGWRLRARVRAHGCGHSRP
ncbi:hypothetical protein SAMN05518669_1404 [Variovorax sp. YR634]|nr:hypothetical protein SAMN05518669_1404 [Variovorax sp. YR634]SOD28542.1 hypothetical protein SAMN05518800_4123 [Variovorax sp. YR752]